VLLIGLLALVISLIVLGCRSVMDILRPGEIPAIGISNLSPTHITFQHNSGTVSVTLTFDETVYILNPTVHWVLLDNSGDLIQATSTAISTPSDIKITVSFAVPTSRLAAGSSGSFQVYLTDSTGKFSDMLEGSWNAI